MLDVLQRVVQVTNLRVGELAQVGREAVVQEPGGDGCILVLGLHGLDPLGQGLGALNRIPVPEAEPLQQGVVLLLERALGLAQVALHPRLLVVLGEVLELLGADLGLGRLGEHEVVHQLLGLGGVGFLVLALGGEVDGLPSEATLGDEILIGFGVLEGLVGDPVLGGLSDDPLVRNTLGSRTPRQDVL